MQRRSFLSLLVGLPAVATLDKAQAGSDAVFPDLAVPEVVVPEVVVPEVVAPEALGFAARLMMYSLPMMLEAGGNIDGRIDAGRFARFIARPQVPFWPERLMISDGGWELYGVSAHGQPQLDDVIPSEIFAPHAYGTRLQFRSMGPGQEIVMAVRNCGSTRPFFATFIGRAVG